VLRRTPEMMIATLLRAIKHKGGTTAGSNTHRKIPQYVIALKDAKQQLL
jgi:hypothetical protein